MSQIQVWILKCNLSDLGLNLNILLDCFKVLVCFHRLSVLPQTHFELHRLRNSGPQQRRLQHASLLPLQAPQFGVFGQGPATPPA